MTEYKTFENGYVSLRKDEIAAQCAKGRNVVLLLMIPSYACVDVYYSRGSKTRFTFSKYFDIDLDVFEKIKRRAKRVKSGEELEKFIRDTIIYLNSLNTQK